MTELFRLRESSKYALRGDKIVISLYGRTFYVPCRYKAGDIMGKAEAQELNRQLAHNIHKNFAHIVRNQALKNGELATQEQLEEYTRTYVFAGRRTTSRRIVTDVDLLEREIAERNVFRKLREKGIQPDRVPKHELNTIIGGLILRGTFRKAAEEQAANANLPLEIDLSTFELELANGENYK